MDQLVRNELPRRNPLPAIHATRFSVHQIQCRYETLPMTLGQQFRFILDALQNIQRGNFIRFDDFRLHNTLIADIQANLAAELSHDEAYRAFLYR